MISTVERVGKLLVAATALSPDEQLDANTPLLGSGVSLDSIGVLELLVALEKEFQIEASADEIVEAKAFQTVGTLADFIDSKTRGTP